MVKPPTSQRYHAKQGENERAHIPCGEVGGERDIRQHVDREDGAGQRDESEAVDDEHSDGVNESPRRQIHRHVGGSKPLRQRVEGNEGNCGQPIFAEHNLQSEEQEEEPQRPQNRTGNLHEPRAQRLTPASEVLDLTETGYGSHVDRNDRPDLNDENPEDSQHHSK